MRLGRAFMELGFRQVRTSSTRGYVVVKRPPQEIDSRLRAMACDDDEVF